MVALKLVIEGERQSWRSNALSVKLSDMLGKIFVVFVFLLSSSGALVPLLRQQSGSTVDATQSDPITQSMWAGIYVLVFFLIVVRWQRFVYSVKRDKLLLLLVGVALVSFLWSAAPTITFVRSVALVGTTLFGAYLAARYSMEEQLRLLAWALGITALLSLLVALALPSYGISSGTSTAGNWQGIFPHKNALGRSMALGIIVFLFLAFGSRRYRWFAWAGVGLSGGLLILSNSITGLLVTLTLLALWPLYAALRWRPTVMVPFMITAVLLVGGVVVLLQGDVVAPVLDTLGREETLTGRTVVWAAALDMIRERPWLGYGYSGFWLGWEGYSAQIFIATGKQFTGAQNGVLDLLLELGLLGMVVFALGFSRALLLAVSWVRYTKTAVGLWPLMFLTFFILYNLSESLTLEQNSIYWVLYVTTVLSLFTQHDVRNETGRTDDTSGRRAKPKALGGLA